MNFAISKLSTVMLVNVLFAVKFLWKFINFIPFKKSLKHYSLNNNVLERQSDGFRYHQPKKTCTMIKKNSLLSKGSVSLEYAWRKFSNLRFCVCLNSYEVLLLSYYMHFIKWMVYIQRPNMYKTRYSRIVLQVPHLKWL